MAVVNIHHGDAYDIYIGRPGKGVAGPLGNPIRVDGRTPCIECGERHKRSAAADALLCYKRWLWRQICEDAEYRELVRSCDGKDLGCFCAPNPCHGYTLAAAAAWLSSCAGLQRFPVPAIAEARD